MTVRWRTGSPAPSRRWAKALATVGVASALAIGGLPSLAAAAEDGAEETQVIETPRTEAETPTQPAPSEQTVEEQAPQAQETAQETIDTRGAAAQSSDLGICVGDELDCFIDRESKVSEWQLARVGLSVEGWGFAPGAAVQVSIDGVSVSDTTADTAGEVAFAFTLEAGPGQHTLTLTSDGESVSGTFLVGADSEWYEGLDAPIISYQSDSVVTVSELADAPLEFGVERISGGSESRVDYEPIDVFLNGEFVDTVTANSIGAVDYELAGPLDAGSYELSFVHPAGTASAEFHVVPDEQGTPPPAGDYFGTSIQTHASSDPLEDHAQRPIRFSIDDEGNISGLEGEYWWACVAGGYHGSDFADFSEDPIPATPLTVDQPFEFSWEGTATTYFLSGTVNPDGTASGQVIANLGVCGSSILNWTAELDGDIPDPDPVYEPEVAVSPGELTESELAEVGVTISGSGFAPESEVSLSVAGADVATSDADADGAVEFVYTSGALGVGTHAVELTAAEGSAAAEFIVTEDETPTPEPDTIPATPPTEDDLTPEAEGGITAPETAAPGDTIDIEVTGVAPGAEVGVWLFSDAVYLGTHATGADGSVQVTIPATAAAGEHRLSVWTTDGLHGWAALTLTAGDAPDPSDPDPSDPDPTDPDSSDPDPSDPDPTDPGPSDPGPGDDGDDVTHGDDGGSDTLPATGAASVATALAIGMMLLMTGIFLVVARRRTA